MPPKRQPQRKVRPKGDDTDIAAVYGTGGKKQKLDNADFTSKAAAVNTSLLNGISITPEHVSKQHIHTASTPTLIQLQNTTVVQALTNGNAAVQAARTSGSSTPTAAAGSAGKPAQPAAPQITQPGRKSLFNAVTNLKVPDKLYPDIDLPIYPAHDVEQHQYIIDSMRQLDQWYTQSGYYLQPPQRAAPHTAAQHSKPRSTYSYVTYTQQQYNTCHKRRTIYDEQPDTAQWHATVPAELLKSKQIRVEHQPLLALTLSNRMRQLSTDDAEDGDKLKRADSDAADDDDVIDAVGSDVDADELDNDYTAKYFDDEDGASDADVFNDNDNEDTM